MQIEDFKDDAYKEIMEFVEANRIDVLKFKDAFVSTVDVFLEIYQVLRSNLKNDDARFKTEVYEHEADFKQTIALLLTTRCFIVNRMSMNEIQDDNDYVTLDANDKALKELINESIELITRKPSEVAQQIADKVFSSM
jgi:hypothetical protein